MRVNTLDEKYKSLVNDIGANGIDKKDRTGTGSRSVFGRQIRHDMREGFPLLTTKKIYWRGVLAELVWFLRGKSDLKFLLDHKCEIWVGDAYKKYSDHYAGYEGVPDRNWFIHEIMHNEQFAEKWGDMGPIYGRQWRDWNGYYETRIKNERDKGGYLIYEKQHIPGIDQIRNLIRELKTNPDSRRLLVNAWQPEQLRDMILPPCHHGFQVWTRELTLKERFALWEKLPNKDVLDFPIGPLEDMSDEIYHNTLDQIGVQKRAISLMWHQRSVDVPLGLPFNIASYGLLLEILGTIVNMVPDQLIGNLGDCHIYNNQIEGITEQLRRDSHPLPTLSINTEFWLTESGECGVGDLDTEACINAFFDDDFCNSFINDNVELIGYHSEPAIKIPLSN
jgi:thymidylate synthase